VRAGAILVAGGAVALGVYNIDKVPSTWGAWDCGPANGPACDEEMLQRQLAQSEEEERRQENKKRTIGLGLDEDLWRNHIVDAITYKEWYKAGLTSIPLSMTRWSRSLFFKSFEEAAANAGAIRFDVTNFKVGEFPNSYTQQELNTILSQGTLFTKTTFWEYDKEMIWSGRQFSPAKR
jgi:hypothetical protein